MTTFFYFLLGSLATYRLALLISKEDGPAWIFRKLRNVPPKKSSAHEGIRCEWCMSLWTSAVVTAALVRRDIVPVDDTMLWWLAMSSVAIILNQAFTKG